jgi:hypothetical protein
MSSGNLIPALCNSRAFSSTARRFKSLSGLEFLEPMIAPSIATSAVTIAPMSPLVNAVWT